MYFFKKSSDITKQNLMNKILVRNESGLCYELNSFLYYFLVDNGFGGNLPLRPLPPIGEVATLINKLTFEIFIHL